MINADLFITKIPRRRGILIFNLVCVLMGLLFFFDFGMVVQTVLLSACRFFNSTPASTQPTRTRSSR